jgi:4-hydroxyphenylpyruvate dioxygenase
MNLHKEGEFDNFVYGRTLMLQVPSLIMLWKPSPNFQYWTIFVGRRKSQIQTYLEQNEGAGLQHLALKTKDIFATIRKMREVSQGLFGFELMKRPSDAYYQELPERLGDQLTPSQYKELQELGILADADDEGVLLQLFTKPVGDRPTFFFEIIQRIGCVIERSQDSDTLVFERPGCGGFGQGNFRELFKAIEEHEKTLKV